MRADRLVQLVMSLQRRPRWTVGELARELDVSERTIFRDLDALSASGVPVTTTRGINGGVALLEGWRTQLTGLTRKELHALAAMGPASALEDLGLGAPLRSGLVKLAAAVPALQQPTLEHARQRLHFDGSPGFFTERESLPHLTRLRDALWQDLGVQLHYRDFDGRESRRAVQPYALVAKGDRWYLVAGDAERGEPRVFRASRIGRLRVSRRRFQRPPDFDLPSFWANWRQRFAEKRPRFEVSLRLDAEGRAALRSIRPPADHAVLDAARRERGGRRWWRVTVDFERESIALSQLCALGPGVEVVSPEALRAQLRAMGEVLVASYGGRREGARASSPHASSPRASSSPRAVAPRRGVRRPRR